MNNRVKVLLVDDDNLLREIYLDLLKGEGYQVEVAVDGDGAFEKMKQGGFDLVLLDVILPKQTGFDVMNRLKNDPPQTPNKAVLFLTNLGNDDEIAQAKQLGNGYLMKSDITPEDFLNQVKKYLQPQNSFLSK